MTHPPIALVAPGHRAAPLPAVLAWITLARALRALLACLLLATGMAAQAEAWEPWQAGGKEGVSVGDAMYPSLAVSPDGRPYVAYQDGPNGSKVTVMRLNTAGTGWEVVGTAGFSDSRAAYLSLAFSPNGVPYVAYQDGDATSVLPRATVMRWDEASQSWGPVGSPRFSEEGLALYTSLGFGPDGTPYLAYRDNGGNARAMRWNGSDAWEAAETGLSAKAFVISLAVSPGPSGRPYVVYMESLRIKVMRLRDDDTWEVVGGTGFSAGFADSVSLAFDPNGKPYVAYGDDNGGGKATVMRLNAAGTGWEAVGNTRFSAGTASYLSLAFGPDGKPYVAYQDAGNSYKATVMRLNDANNLWQPVGAASASVNAVLYNSLAFAGGRPILAFRDGSTGLATVLHLVDAPGPPPAISATAGNLQAMVQWSAPDNSGGSLRLVYTATASPGGAACTATAPALSCSVTGLTAGQFYNFTVTARNAAGISAASASATATPFSSATTTVPGMAGNATAVLTGGGVGCTLAPGAGFGAASSVPEGRQLPYGQFSFQATGCNAGSTLTLNLTYPTPLPASVQFWKYGPAAAGAAESTWFEWTGATLSGDRMTVSYTINDNGVGDSDATVGQISDPFAPALAAAVPGAGVTSIPTLSQWGLMLLALLLGGMAWRQGVPRRR
ncbi:IPTL-CTERM sorting domain-containing protein [Xylophilus sp. GW821-FHT01B05]